MAQEIWCPYMVGQVITVDGEADPNAHYQGTRWTRIAEGRVLVGIGTGADSNNVTRTFTAGDNPGEYAHADTVEEMPRHQHFLATTVNASKVLTEATNAISAGGYAYVEKGGKVTVGGYGGQYGYTGATEPHNNVQPTYGVNYWRRDD